MLNLLFGFNTVIPLPNAMNVYTQYTTMPDVEAPECVMMPFKINGEMSDAHAVIRHQVFWLMNSDEHCFSRLQ